MKIFLENLYHSDCYFLPIRDNQQLLVGVELITHFSSEDGTVRIPDESGYSATYRGATLAIIFRAVGITKICLLYTSDAADE